MSPARTSARFLLLALAFAAGCSSDAPKGQSPPPQIENLTDVANMLRDYTAEKGRGPAKLADLAKHEQLYSRGYQGVRTGELVVVWGAAMPQTGGGGAEVIAYEKKVETEGGYVLLQNGETKRMTAAELAAAPKAK